MWTPDVRSVDVVARTPSSGMPTVRPTCWVEVTRPVAGPCSPSGDAGGDGQAVGDDRAQVAHAGQRNAAVASATDQPPSPVPAGTGRARPAGERADQGAAGAEAADDPGAYEPATTDSAPCTPKTRPVWKADRCRTSWRYRDEDEDHRRHHREGDQPAQVAPRHRAAPQHRQRDERSAVRGLDEDEGGQEQQARDEGDEDVGAAEAVFGGRRQGVDQGEQAAGDGDRAGDVEAGALGGAGLGQQAGGEGQHDQGEQRQQAHGGPPAQQVGRAPRRPPCRR